VAGAIEEGGPVARRLGQCGGEQSFFALLGRGRVRSGVFHLLLHAQAGAKKYLTSRGILDVLDFLPIGWVRDDLQLRFIFNLLRNTETWRRMVQ
jgi:hypothetical protein